MPYSSLPYLAPFSASERVTPVENVLSSTGLSGVLHHPGRRSLVCNSGHADCSPHWACEASGELFKLGPTVEIGSPGHLYFQIRWLYRMPGPIRSVRVKLSGTPRHSVSFPVLFLPFCLHLAFSHRFFFFLLLPFHAQGHRLCGFLFSCFRARLFPAR